MVHVIGGLIKGSTFLPEKMNDWKAIHPTRIHTIPCNSTRKQQHIVSRSPEIFFYIYNKTIYCTIENIRGKSNLDTLQLSHQKGRFEPIKLV